MWIHTHLFCLLNNRFWTNDFFYFIFFLSFHTLTHPYAAPSVLHIAVLFSIGPAHKLATLQLETQIMDWVFAREIKPFQVHICLIPPPSLDLNGDSFSWLHTLKLSVLAGGQRAARAWTPSAEGQFAKEGPGGKGLCLCWLRAPLQFNRLDLFQTSQPTNSVDTQGEVKWRERMIREEMVISVCCLKEVWMTRQFIRFWFWIVVQR